MIFHTQIESGVWIPIQDSLEPQIRDKYYQDRNESLKTMYIPYVYILLQIYYYIYVCCQYFWQTSSTSATDSSLILIQDSIWHRAQPI